MRWPKVYFTVTCNVCQSHGFVFSISRSGKLLKGDELLIVNGQQLQGVSLEEARKLLRVPEAEVHLLVAREVSFK